jgi:outer membrane lipoprotein-sorting protein
MRVRAVSIRLMAVAIVVAGLGVGVVARRAVSSPALPSVQAADLAGSVIRALHSDPSVSGEVLVHIDLGIPALPEVPGAPAGPASYLSGDHRARVWRSPDGFRISETLPAAERSVYATRSDVWVWDSSTFTAKRLRLPPPDAGPDGPAGMAENIDPVEAARRALDLAGPTTAIRVSPPVRIAGRSAYNLVVEPRTTETLIGRIEISIDSATRLPLRVAVFARGATEAALSTGFTSVSFEPVDPSVFRFTPPEGSKVDPVEPPRRAPGAGPTPVRGPGARVGPPAFGPARTFGHDWTTVLAVRVPPADVLLGTQAASSLARLLPFSGPLFSVRLADRGDHAWLLIGPVPQARLAELERRLH